MILIADSGSTKTEWCLIDRKGATRYFTTEGYNPYFVEAPYIVNSIMESAIPVKELQDMEEINFYGAGCQADKVAVIEAALKTIFPSANIHAEVDLLATARSLLGREPGFAAILGTGTNTCTYNGTVITRNIDSLGFVLGDEGSGGFMGKKLLCDYMRDNMPALIKNRFLEKYALRPETIMDAIYTKPMANRYCAGFASFIHENISEVYMYNLVKDSFEQFFGNLVSRYPDYKSLSFNCVGSVGYYFKNILEEVVNQFNMPMGRVIQSPMEGLIKYHTEES